ncbi:MAG: DUF1559 domain-containing protein [Planctomycetes bacterium]|nr:DUF1559 domain-containing protein [Planctomycetota bacterium]
MAIVTCSDCSKKLKVADTSLGKKVKCTCGNVFVAQEAEAAAPARPAPVAAGDKVMVECTECSAKLKVAATSLGKKMKCPKCASVFIAAAEEEEPPAKTVKKTPPVVVAVDDDEEEVVKPRAKTKPAKTDEDDLFMFAQGQSAGDDEVEETKPRARAKKSDDDEQDDWAPPKSKASKASKARPPQRRDDDDEPDETPVYPSRLLANLFVVFLLLVYCGLFLVSFLDYFPLAKNLGIPVSDGSAKKTPFVIRKDGAKDEKTAKENKKADIENEKDIDALQGTWIVESAAQASGPVAMTGHKFIFAGTNVTTPEPAFGPFKLDANKNPKWIEFPTAVRANLVAIYTLDENTLTCCWAIPQKKKSGGEDIWEVGERPTKFDAKQGVLVVMKREKKDDNKTPDIKDKEKDKKDKDKTPPKGKGLDATKLLGAWVVESALANGKTNDQMQGEFIEFANGKVTGLAGPNSAPYSVNGANDPAWFDVKPAPNITVAAILKFDGAKLVLCAPGGKDSTQRPKTFDAKESFLLVLRRATKDDSRYSRSQSSNNLRQIGIAILNHHDQYKILPPAASSGDKDPTGKPLLSWRVAILPYIEQLDLYKEFDLNKAWDDPHNLKLVAKMPKLFMVPGVSAKEGMTHYRTLVGPGTLLNPQKGPDGKLIAKYTLAKVPDGTSNVIMVVEAKDPTIWTKPDDLPYDPKGPLPKFGVIPAGFHAMFADASVRFIGSQVAEAVLRPYLTCDNGMPRAPLDPKANTGKDKEKDFKPKEKKSDKDLDKKEPTKKLSADNSWRILAPVVFVQDSAPATWKVPKGWKKAKGNPFTVAAFDVQDKGKQVAVTVSVLNGMGGGLIANVNRWRAQLKLPEWSEDELAKAMKKRKVDRIAGYHVEFTGEKGGQPSTLLGVIVFRERDAWFFKLAGDPVLANREKGNFLKFVDSVKFK